MNISPATSLHRACSLLVAAFALSMPVHSASAQGLTGFTYQGSLKDANGVAINSPTTLRFQLFRDATGNTSLAGPVTVSNVPVSNGLLSAEVDFGNIFQSGSGGWVEVAVLNAAGNATILSPRQKITPAPLASGIAGLTLVQGQSTDVDNTAGTVDFAQFGGGGSTTAYLSFTAGITGRLSGVTFRLFQLSNPFSLTMYATVYTGVGTGGSVLGGFEQVVPSGDGFGEFTLDLTSQNISVIAGQTYSVSILCGTQFSGTNSPAPGTSGLNSGGSTANWWFRTRVLKLLGPAYAVEAGSATTATTALSLNANATSALRDTELRLRSATDSNHGLGYFGGTNTFRNLTFAPHGPVLFGNSGGGLGTSNQASGRIALSWANTGRVVVPGQLSVGGDSSSQYRLELPNVANPSGQGRANAWVTYSSRELKQNIETLADPLTIINRLRGVSFDWKQPNADGTHTHDMGFIAEEVAAVLPELVTITTDGKATGLDYGRIVPLAIEAIKQQQTTIESLRNDTAKRESENADLKARLAAVEAALSRMSRNNK